MRPMRWRAAIATILGLFVGSRIVVLLVAALVEQDLALSYHGPTFSDAPLLRSLTGSDAVYFLGIARDGYHVQPVQLDFHDWAFFPLFPLLTRLASVVTLGDLAVAGVLISNLAFVAALVVLYRLALRHLDPDGALRSLAFVAFAPGAVAFAMAYSDSLFLLLAAAAFLAAEDKRWWLAAACYALATLTRLQGVLLGIPLLILVVQQAGTWRTPRVGWLLAGPAAFAGFAAYLGAVVGDPLGMLHAQEAWSAIGTEQGAGGGGTAAGLPVVDRLDPLVLLLVGLLLVYVFLLVYLRPDRVPLPYAAMAVIGLLTVFATLRIQSVTRYLAVVWPFDWVLARRHAALFPTAALAVSAGLFTVMAFLNFSQTLAP